MRKHIKQTVTKEFSFDCAHMLANHEGLCRNLHGHQYKLFVTVSILDERVSQNEASEGMIVDFKDLKRIVNTLIVDKYDHALVLDEFTNDEFEQELLVITEKYNKKTVLLPYRPTAENMAEDFFDQIDDYLEDNKQINCQIEKIRLYETPTSYSEVIKDEK